MRIPGIPYHQGRNDYTDADGRHYGIAIHNTSNTASDTAESVYADHRTDGTSSHFYVDRDSVTQSLDTDDKAGHAGSRQGNENAIAFEITGTNDKSRDWWLANVAWDQLGYVIAYILRHDPDYAGFEVRRASVGEMKSSSTVRAFYGHDDMRRAWGGTTHTDPGPNFPWDRLFQVVNAALAPPQTQQEEDPMPFVAKDTNSGQYYVCDLITSRPVPDFAVKDVLYLAKQLSYGHGVEGAEWTDGGWTRVGWTEAAFGAVLKPAEAPTPGGGSVAGTYTVTVAPAA